MKPDGKRQGKRDKQQSRRTDPGGWKALDQRPAREQRDDGHSHHEKKKCIVHWRQTPHEVKVGIKRAPGAAISMPSRPRGLLGRVLGNSLSNPAIASLAPLEFNERLE